MLQWTQIHASLSILVSSMYMPSSGITGLYSNSISSILRHLHTVLHSGCTSLLPANSVREFHFLYNLSIIYCLEAILTAAGWYLILVLICISLMSDVEHLFMCLLTICMSSLEKCLFSSLAHFLIGSFIFLGLSCMNCLYILENLCQLFCLLLFSPILKAVFSPL